MERSRSIGRRTLLETSDKKLGGRRQNSPIEETNLDVREALARIVHLSCWYSIQQVPAHKLTIIGKKEGRSRLHSHGASNLFESNRPSAARRRYRGCLSNHLLKLLLHFHTVLQDSSLRLHFESGWWLRWRSLPCPHKFMNGELVCSSVGCLTVYSLNRVERLLYEHLYPKNWSMLVTKSPRHGLKLVLKLSVSPLLPIQFGPWRSYLYARISRRPPFG